MRIPRWALAAATTAAAAALTAPASFAAPAATGPPPPPTATGGQKVTTVASGLGTPTSFAFGHGTVFEGDGGNSEKIPNGGVFVLSGGAGHKLPGSPNFVGGLTWHAGALYLSAGTVKGKGVAWTLQRWSGFNGTRFSQRKVLWTAPTGVDGLNGIAFGPDGRLYVGMDVGLVSGGDHGPASAKTPYRYDILSFTSQGKGLKVFATGIRQPWQFAFAPGSGAPFVSSLGQDKGAKNPLDAVLRVHQGDDYGFPQCNLSATAMCAGYTRPWATFTPHTDIMGLAVIGKRLYMTSFTGVSGKGPGGEVLSMPLSGGKARPLLTGFVAPTVGLGARGHRLYVGELTGQVFSVRP